MRRGRSSPAIISRPSDRRRVILAWKAVTMPCQTSANAGHRHRAGPANDRECPCLTLRSGTYRARTRLRRPPLRASQSMPLTCWYACGTDAHSENRSAHVRIMAGDVSGSGFTARRSRPSRTLLTSTNSGRASIRGCRRPLCVRRSRVLEVCGSRTGRARARTVLVGTVMLTVAQLLDR